MARVIDSKIIGRAPSKARRQAWVTCYFGLIYTCYLKANDEMRIMTKFGIGRANDIIIS